MTHTDPVWNRYATHRARLTEALSTVASASGGRLCLLGAGDCNDVDLALLSRVYSEIHLVDLDATALGRAVAREPPEVRARLRPHPRVDLSGLATRAKKWKRRPPSVAQVEASAIEAIEGLLARLPGPFDVVASACVLTQMSFDVRRVLGDGHPSLELVRLSLAALHLHTLVELTARGGSALFVTDVTSSNVFPLDALDGTEDLHNVLRDITRSNAAYHSANPELVRTLLASGTLAEQTGEPELLSPWLWSGQFERTYFVYALRIPRTA